MKRRILNVLAILCGVTGLMLAIAALMFTWAGVTRMGDGAAVMFSGILAAFYGLAAFLYLRAFVSYRKLPNVEHATDILVGTVFASWASLIMLPSVPDDFHLFGYTVPKSISLLVVSYGFYRISKLVLIRNEN